MSAFISANSQTGDFNEALVNTSDNFAEMR